MTNPNFKVTTARSLAGFGVETLRHSIDTSNFTIHDDVRCPTLCITSSTLSPSIRFMVYGMHELLRICDVAQPFGIDSHNHQLKTVAL